MKKSGMALLACGLLMGCNSGINESQTDSSSAGRTVLEKRERPFPIEAGTVFLADFDGNAVNAVTRDTGVIENGAFVPDLGNLGGIGLCGRTSVQLPLNKWSYVAVSLDGTTLKLYLNGVLDGSTPQAGGSENSSYDLGIGNATDDGFDIPFTGTIDAVRLSNCPRSAFSIMVLAAQGGKAEYLKRKHGFIVAPNGMD